MADTPNTETPELDVETTTGGSEAATETVVTETAPEEPSADTAESEEDGDGEGGDGGTGGVGTLVEPDPEPTPESEADAPEEAATEEAAPEAASSEASEEPTLVEAAVEAVTDAAEAVAETVTEAVESAVETVTDAVSGDDEAASSTDDTESTAHGAAVGYTGKDLGRTVTLEELEQADAANAGVSGIGASSQVSEMGADPDEMESLYENSLSAVEADQIVTGTVVGLTDKEVVVDIGFKSDGVVAKNEFGITPEIGEKIDVYVDRLEDRRGQLTLSYSKGIDKSRWNIVQEAMESGAVIEGEIVKRIKGGMIVNLLGAEAFLPGSQVDVRPVRDFDVYLGKTMEFKVVKTNPGNGNIVISHKALIEKDLQAQRTLILDSLEVGQVLEGVVKNIVNFGVFVDLGGVDGLLHITDLSWGRVGHPSEVVELDQKMQVVVLDYDKERQRISLGYKQLQKHPWDDLAERLAEGMEIEGRVVSITDYGAFVEIERGIEGLVHISEMSWTEHVKHPTQRVQLGQTVKVKVLKVDGSDKKISLGMKQLEPDPWEGLLERFPVGTITRGKVRNITTFGAFVEIEPGIDGLVHVSDLSWTKRVKHPSEVVKKGQELDVIVVDIDIAQRRISLGHKQVSTDPWSQYAEIYAEGADTTATVTEINDGGLVVELPLEAEAFVPASHLDRSGRPADAYQIGDTLELRIIRMDREDREIVGSETAKGRASEQAEKFAERQAKTQQRQQERREIESYGSRSSSGPATLGELSGLAALRDQLADSEAAQEQAANAPASATPQLDDDETVVEEVTMETSSPTLDPLEDPQVPDELKKTAGEVVEDALGEDDPQPDAELGKAAADVEGDLEDAADDATGDEEE
ncbi:MAG: 30S ribosomal protein S1 [Rubricoccaceae bacterium]